MRAKFQSSFFGDVGNVANDTTNETIEMAILIALGNTTVTYFGECL